MKSITVDFYLHKYAFVHGKYETTFFINEVQKFILLVIGYKIVKAFIQTSHFRRRLLAKVKETINQKPQSSPRDGLRFIDIWPQKSIRDLTPSGIFAQRNDFSGFLGIYTKNRANICQWKASTSSGSWADFFFKDARPSICRDFFSLFVGFKLKSTRFFPVG